MTPAINVNMKPCMCAARAHHQSITLTGRHFEECSGSPVLIPCPIPRSVKFEVVLGGCKTPGACSLPRPMFQATTQHISTCPARPVRVSCSVSGSTWEESYLSFVERSDGDAIGPEFDRVDSLCRERWALVKALVLRQQGFVAPAPDHIVELHAQRDAVFAALADMVRHEKGLEEAAQSAAKAMGGEGDMSGAVVASAEFLAAYVERLIEQVSVLP
jgi:hypothetical protein